MEALGRPRKRNTPPELWSGISTFDSADIAAAVGRRFGHGDFLAALAITPDGPIRWEKTRGEGHYTLWGTPQEFLASIIEIVAVPDTVDEAEA